MTDWAKFHSFEANADMIEGYRDGLDLDSPKPSDNRSASYRHGFANGRDDRAGKPRASFDELCDQAIWAIATDAQAKVA